MGPGDVNTNGAIMKRFKLPQERWGAFEFRGEAFNLLNFVNLGQPTNSMVSPAVGRILNSGEARIFQLGLRYDF